MADKKLTCKSCSQEFIFSERDQAFYQDKGFSAPQSCQACRAKRKAEQGGGRGFNKPSGNFDRPKKRF